MDKITSISYVYSIGCHFKMIAYNASSHTKEYINMIQLQDHQGVSLNIMLCRISAFMHCPNMDNIFSALSACIVINKKTILFLANGINA